MEVLLAYDETNVQRCELTCPPRQGEAVHLDLDGESREFRAESIQWDVDEDGATVTVELGDVSRDDTDESNVE